MKKDKSPGAHSWRTVVPLFLISLLILGCGLIRSGTPTQPSLPQEGTLTVLFLDIGQGDSILVLSPNGHTMLIDGGNSSKDADQVIVPTLKAHGYDRLDFLVATHPDQDHIGGLVAVLQEIPVKYAVFTGQEHTTQTYEAFLEEVSRLKNAGQLTPVKARRGVALDFDPALKVEVLGPGDDVVQTGDTNNASVVIRLTYKAVSFVFTGDAEDDEESWILSQGGDVRAQILKISHHGSKNGTGEAWLKAMSPEVAVISVGADNRYGHPSSQVIERLARRKIKIYRTDQQGTITVTTDGNSYQVSTEK
ncbi:MAG: MBL fold metallo-hydrolase [Anaerolineae bacterium]|jgi:beta-lactamase superfamily II metal-dependent hydrolase|nr:MBL fold metallo-hydrolase [Anaerolineae bacterium]MDH7473803.1 ComEC/Rec2 family competence protein [Anaerolineae bacterium]